MSTVYLLHSVALCRGEHIGKIHAELRCVIKEKNNKGKQVPCPNVLVEAKYIFSIQ